jgi:hypothetical protein
MKSLLLSAIFISALAAAAVVLLGALVFGAIEASPAAWALIWAAIVFIVIAALAGCAALPPDQP